MANSDRSSVTRHADAVEVRWTDGTAATLPNLLQDAYYERDNVKNHLLVLRRNSGG